MPATDDASGVAAPVYVTTSVAVRGPVAVGANARLIMQLAPAFRLVVHELDDTTKSLGARPIVVIAMPLIAAFELFVSVNADVGVAPASGSAQKFVLPAKRGRRRDDGAGNSHRRNRRRRRRERHTRHRLAQSFYFDNAIAPLLGDK